MASSYLDLYQGAGGLYQRNILGMESPYTRPQVSFGTPQNVSYRAGETQRVVHDTLNNKYYGTQKQSDLVKGLEASIKRTQGKLTSSGETRYSTGWMGSLNSSYYRYSAQDRKDQNALIKQQQSYLKQIRGGNYGQEGKDFFKSYDAYTQGWNNVFTGRYNNNVMNERNAVTEERNRQQEARNKKIEGRNDVYKRGMGAGLDIGNGSKALRAPTKTNKTISTGIQSKADELTASLGIGRSGLGI